MIQHHYQIAVNTVFVLFYFLFLLFFSFLDKIILVLLYVSEYLLGSHPEILLITLLNKTNYFTHFPRSLKFDVCQIRDRCLWGLSLKKSNFLFKAESEAVDIQLENMNGTNMKEDYSKSEEILLEETSVRIAVVFCFFFFLLFNMYWTP